MPLTFPSLAYAGSGTWAAKPAANTVAAGSMYFATDLGENGVLLMSNGTRWRAVNGEATLKTLAAESAALTNTESIQMQTLLPLGAWQSGDALRVRFTMTKSGTTDAGRATVRVGTAGTTADTAITGISALGVLGASSVAGGFEYDIRLVSATSARRVGTNAVNLSGYGAGNAGAGAVATTITDASANALYVSVGFSSAGATDTVTVTSGSIRLVTA